MDRLEYLQAVEEILNANIPIGHNAIDTVMADAECGEDPQDTADLIKDQMPEFEQRA